MRDGRTKAGPRRTPLRVAGEGAQAVADAAAKVAGVTKVLLAEAPELGARLPENLARWSPRLGGLMNSDATGDLRRQKA